MGTPKGGEHPSHILLHRMQESSETNVSQFPCHVLS